MGIKQLTKDDLDAYIREARHFPVDFFCKRHENADFLVSHGPIIVLKEDESGMITQKLPNFAFATQSGGSVEDLVRKEYPAGSVVFELPWHNMDPLLKSMLVIGRAPNAAIHIKDVNVSKFHGYFSLDRQTGLVYVDQKSTNGTRINGKRAEPETKITIKYDDTIVLAGKYKFTYHSSETFYKRVLEKLK